MPRGQKNKITYSDSPQFKNMGVRMISSGKSSTKSSGRKTTAKDMPGSGLAKKAAKAAQGRHKQIESKVNKATGYKK